MHEASPTTETGGSTQATSPNQAFDEREQGRDSKLPPHRLLVSPPMPCTTGYYMAWMSLAWTQLKNIHLMYFHTCAEV